MLNMRKMLIVLSLVIVSIFIVGCGTGQAVRVKNVEKQISAKSTMCLKDYEINAYAVNMEGHVGAYAVNDVSSGNLKSGESSVLAGVKLTHNGSVIQDYAGGVRGTQFKLEKACLKDYSIFTYYSLDDSMNGVTEETNGVFVINGEEFGLKEGNSKVLTDGTKVILRNILHQSYAGGYQGLQFELICS